MDVCIDMDIYIDDYSSSISDAFINYVHTCMYVTVYRYHKKYSLSFVFLNRDKTKVQLFH